MRRVLLSLAFFLGTSSAAAEPLDRWDAARYPGLERDERVLDEAVDRLEDAGSTGNTMLRQQAASEARALLDQIGGAKARDERVRYFYGRSLAILNDDSGVIAALEPVMKQAFLHPVGVHVMFDLAVAYAKVERFRDEIAVYGRLLEENDSSGSRLTILANRGESRAKIGDFAGAVADFEKAIALNPIEPLSRWGLVVVLDRWGDLSRAIKEGGYAWDSDGGSRSRLDGAGVFFVPPQDKWWYHAVRRLSAAFRVQSPEERLGHLLAADRFYELYLAQAPSTDPWVSLARARRKMLALRIAEARKQAPAQRPRTSPR